MIKSKHTNSIDYKVNKLNYRAPEFDSVDWKNSYIIQGCSAVFGLGTLRDDQITSFYLSKLLDAPVINLGIPGAGMELQFVNTLEMLEAGIKPRGVFIVYPSMDRYTLYKNNEFENVGPWSDNKKLEWMLNDNSRTHNLYLMRGYRMLWELAGVPLCGEWSHHGNNQDFCKEVITWKEYLDFGFDNQHWGPKTSEAVANILFDQFKKRTSKTI